MSTTTEVDDLLASLPPRVSRFPFHWAEKTPDAPAYLEGDRTCTYRELALAVSEAVSFLRASGLRPGDRLLLLNENCAQAIIFILAAQEMDAWPVPVNARLAAAEIEAIAGHCEPRLVVYTSEVSEEAKEHARRCGAFRTENPRLGAFDISSLNEQCSPEMVHPNPADQVAALLYTTGTTGLPKAVMLSHRNLQYNVAIGAQIRQVTAADRLYGSLPISHVYGLASMALLTLYTGASARLVRRYTPEDLLEGLERGGVTVLQAVPAMYSRLLKYLGAAGRKSITHRLRFMQTGGAPLDPSLKDRTETLFGLPLHNSYGLTESSPTLVMTRIEAPRSDTAVGCALPGGRVRLGEDASCDFSAQPAEILAQGPNIMLGYYKDPVATAAALAPGGWLRTGDLAVQLPDGAFQIMGRAKEVIIRSGLKVHPAEVEAALGAHPAVSQSVVVGHSLEDGNEEPIAFIELSPGRSGDAEMFKQFLADRLAPYKRPARYVFLPALPASPTGKVLRKQLKEMAASLQPEGA